MNKDEIIQLVTTQVISKLGSAGASHDHSAGGSCSVCGGGESWNGVGSIADFMKAGAQRVSTLPPFGACPDPGLARFIDHTLLKAEATRGDIEKLCAEAHENCFMSVCVNPTWVRTAAKALQGSGVKVCTVIGFPLGATPTRVKELETRIAIDDGAGEVDMVVNIGALKSGDHRLVENDIRGVVRATRGSVISKVILETCLLTKDEIKTGCQLSQRAGANFVKTSTGFSKGGATAEDIALMRETVGSEMGVKASGGVRDHEGALEMLHAGASRIGASASVAIVNCEDAGGGKY